MKRKSFSIGDHLVICDYSGFKALRSECKKTWDGYLVLKRFWEPRHPQDFVRGVRDRQNVRDPRPEQEDRYITAADISAEDL